MVWAEAVTAISTALLAVFAAIVGFGFLFMFAEIRRLTPELRRLAETLDRDGRPVMQSMKSLVEEAGKTVTTVRQEVEALADTSRGVRGRVEDAVASIEDRLVDLDSLLDVVQDEVEGTALDIAAALRTTRRGGKLFRRMKRALTSRRR